MQKIKCLVFTCEVIGFVPEMTPSPPGRLLTVSMFVALHKIQYLCGEFKKYLGRESQINSD